MTATTGRTTTGGEAERTTGTVKPAPSPIAGQGRSPMRWRPWPAIRGPRCWPAARAWSRCSPCGWPRPRCSSTSTGCPGWTRSPSTTSGVTVGALARHADVLASADVRRVQPLVTMALRARRARHHPQPRHHGRLARARRRGRGDAGRARPARRLARGRGAGRAAHHPGRRALRRPAGVERAPRRDRGLGVLPGPRRGRGRGLRRDRPPARRLRAGRRGRARSTATPSRSATSRWPTSRPWSTSPACPTTGSARSRWSTSSRATTSTPPPTTAPSWCAS